MDYKLNISNFKCFDHLEVPIKPLTIFAGSNSSGKSSVIQTLLLARIAFEKALYQKNNVEDNLQIVFADYFIPLNGPYNLSLGSSENLRCRFMTEYLEDLTLTMVEVESSHTAEIKYSFLVPESQLLSINLKSINISNNIGHIFPIFKHEFHYLNAERIGPRIKQEIKQNDFPYVGSSGEFTAQVIADLEFEKKVDEERIFKFSEITSKFLKDQINLWLDFILPGVQITAEKSLSSFTASILVSSDNEKYNNYPTNVGFGISYVLPIVTTCLVAEKGSQIIVENPEAHLHPSAQSKMGRFLGLMAEAGLNIIVETHSEHIINGIQVLVAGSNLSADNVAINFFQSKSRNTNEVQQQIIPLNINELGELSRWPNGFFDQNQVDFIELNQKRSHGS
jgi:predicted ATPase